MKAIILDGFFAGLVMHHDGNPNLRLARPASITVCSCDPNFEYLSNDQSAHYIDYKLAARGYDDSAVYSLSGNLFDPMTKSRDWAIDPKKSPYHRKDPIYFHCREEQAWEESPNA